MTRFATPEGGTRRPGRLPLVLACLAVAGALLASALGGAAHAQRFDPKRPLTLVVGPSPGLCAADRVDPQRTGLARAPLPTGTLHIAWHRSLGQDIDQAPLVTVDGDIVTLGARGEIVTLDAGGGELGRVSAGVGSAGPGAILSDGTVVFVNAAGEAVGVRRDAVRFRTRVGERAAATRAAPLPLADGGAVLADGADLVTLDAEGDVRARVTLPEPAGAPLLSTGDRVVAVGISGTVYLWPPGREATRVGSFGASVDNAAALADPRTLLAVVDSTHLAALDLEHGVVVTRAAVAGTFMLTPLALRGQVAYVLEQTPGAVLAVAIDPAGRELIRAVVTTTPASALGDGGAPVLTLGARSATLVDSAGTLAFVTPDGTAGIVTSGGVDTLADGFCIRGSGRTPALVVGPGSFRPAQGVVGLVPAGAGAFLVACQNGQLSKITAAAVP